MSQQSEYTLRQAADRLDVTTKALLMAIRRGTLKAELRQSPIQPRGYYVIAADELDRYEHEHHRKA